MYNGIILEYSQLLYLRQTTVSTPNGVKTALVNITQTPKCHMPSTNQFVDIVVRKLVQSIDLFLIARTNVCVKTKHSLIDNYSF